MAVTASKGVNVLYSKNPNDSIQIPFQKLVHFPIEKLWFFSIITRYGADIQDMYACVSRITEPFATIYLCVNVCVGVCLLSANILVNLHRKKRRLIVQKSSRKSTGFHGIPESGTTQSQQVFANIVFEWACMCQNFS